MRILRIAVFLVCSLFAVDLWAQQSVEIRVNQANARETPDSSADVLAVLRKGEIRPVVDDVPYWYGVELLDGRKAWVAKSLCTLVLGEEEDDPADEIGQPLTDLYALPVFGASVTLPNCTPTTLNVDWSICPADGKSESGGQSRNWRTNQKKNRISSACSYPSLTHAQVLDLKPLPGNVRTLPTTDTRVSYLQSLEATPVVVEGNLSMVKAAEKESTNCYSAQRKDLHFELLPSDQGDPKTRRDEIVITEVTPWFSEAIAGWTNANLGQFASYRGGYSGSLQRAPARVRVYGWLFYDDPHSGDGSVGNWRGSAWEIHPITRIEVFENGMWREIR